MPAFPTLAEPVILPASKLSHSTIEANALGGAIYVVLEPSGSAVHVRAATVDEEMEYERSHGSNRVYHSTDEFLEALERNFEDE